MAARRKQKSFACDLDAIHANAAQLLSLRTHAIAMDWTEWELDFLESMTARTSDEPLSQAQIGKFAQLNRVSALYARIDGLSLVLLIANCALEADDLSEDDDRAFVRGLRQTGAKELRRRDLGKLLRCCRELEVIESHHGFEDETSEPAI